MTTHSPHVVSISPLRSLVLLRRTPSGDSKASSAAMSILSDSEEEDIERYLDVTRAEAVFARGLIFVEGEAEQYLVPAFARIAGFDLDEAGVSVSAVHGTHFEAYLKFFGPGGLGIPHVVLTDRDPHAEGTHGLPRVRRLLTNVFSSEVENDNEVSAEASSRGIFINSHTLEVDVLRCGQHAALAATLAELAPGETARGRALQVAADPTVVPIDRFLADIGVIGKGRFAQRLASRLSPNDGVPSYISEAFEYLKAAL